MHKLRIKTGHLRLEIAVLQPESGDEDRVGIIGVGSHHIAGRDAIGGRSSGDRGRGLLLVVVLDDVPERGGLVCQLGRRLSADDGRGDGIFVDAELASLLGGRGEGVALIWRSCESRETVRGPQSGGHTPSAAMARRAGGAFSGHSTVERVQQLELSKSDTWRITADSPSAVVIQAGRSYRCSAFERGWARWSRPRPPAIS
jgi:hypothetical protein